VYTAHVRGMSLANAPTIDWERRQMFDLSPSEYRNNRTPCRDEYLPRTRSLTVGIVRVGHVGFPHGME